MESFSWNDMRMPECVQVLQGIYSESTPGLLKPYSCLTLDERGYFGHAERIQLVRGRAQRRVRPPSFVPGTGRRSRCGQTPFDRLADV